MQKLLLRLGTDVVDTSLKGEELYHAWIQWLGDIAEINAFPFTQIEVASCSEYFLYPIFTNDKKDLQDRIESYMDNTFHNIREKNMLLWIPIVAKIVRKHGHLDVRRARHDAVGGFSSLPLSLVFDNMIDSVEFFGNARYSAYHDIKRFHAANYMSLWDGVLNHFDSSSEHTAWSDLSWIIEKLVCDFRPDTYTAYNQVWNETPGFRDWQLKRKIELKHMSWKDLPPIFRSAHLWQQLLFHSIHNTRGNSHAIYNDLPIVVVDKLNEFLQLYHFRMLSYGPRNSEYHAASHSIQNELLMLLNINKISELVLN